MATAELPSSPRLLQVEQSPRTLHASECHPFVARSSSIHHASPMSDLSHSFNLAADPSNMTHTTATSTKMTAVWPALVLPSCPPSTRPCRPGPFANEGCASRRCRHPASPLGPRMLAPVSLPPTELNEGKEATPNNKTPFTDLTRTSGLGLVQWTPERYSLLFAPLNPEPLDVGSLASFPDL